MRSSCVCSLLIACLITALGASHTFRTSVTNHIDTRNYPIEETSNDDRQISTPRKHDEDQKLLHKSSSSIRGSAPQTPKQAASRLQANELTMNTAASVEIPTPQQLKHGQQESVLGYRELMVRGLDPPTSVHSERHSQPKNTYYPESHTTRSNGASLAGHERPSLYARASTKEQDHSPSRESRATTSRPLSQSLARQNGAPHPNHQRNPTGRTRVHVLRPLTLEMLALQARPNGRDRQAEQNSGAAATPDVSIIPRLEPHPQGELQPGVPQSSSSTSISSSLSSSTSSTSSPVLAETQTQQSSRKRKRHEDQVTDPRRQQEIDAPTSTLARRHSSVVVVSDTTSNAPKLVRRGGKKGSKPNSRSSSTQSLQSASSTKSLSSNPRKANPSSSIATSSIAHRVGRQTLSPATSLTLDKDEQSGKKKRSRKKSSKSASQNSSTGPESTPVGAGTSSASSSSKQKKAASSSSQSNIPSRLSPIKVRVGQGSGLSQSSSAASIGNALHDSPTGSSAKSFYSANSDLFGTPAGSKDSQKSPFTTSPQSLSTQTRAQLLQIAPSPFSNARPSLSTSVPGSPMRERARPFHNAHSRSYSAPVSMMEDAFQHSTQSPASRTQSKEGSIRKPAQELPRSPASSSGHKSTSLVQPPSSLSPKLSYPKSLSLGSSSSSPSTPEHWLSRYDSGLATPPAQQQPQGPSAPVSLEQQHNSQARTRISPQTPPPRETSQRPRAQAQASSSSAVSATTNHQQSPATRAQTLPRTLPQEAPQAQPQNMGQTAFQAIRAAFDPIVLPPVRSRLGPIGSPTRGSPVRGNLARNHPAPGAGSSGRAPRPLGQFQLQPYRRPHPDDLDPRELGSLFPPGRGSQ